MGAFFRLEVYKKVGISRVDALKRAGKNVIHVFKRALQNALKQLTNGYGKGFKCFYCRYLKGVPFFMEGI